jgi:biopolymer transport protein ExbD
MNGSRAPLKGWGAAVDAWALGMAGTGLALLTLGLLLVPQRLAQRPASQGIVSLHLARDGQLRLWNQPIAAGRLLPVLSSFETAAARPTLRLVLDGDVPWGSVQRLVERLSRTGLTLELQLP